jgi:protease I
MKSDQLSGKTIAFLATDGFERSELVETKRLLEKAGATVDVISPQDGAITSWNNNNWGDDVEVNVRLQHAAIEKYDALVLPGGVINPDRLRLDGDAVRFIQRIAHEDKPIAAICHGPQMLIEAGLVKGRDITSWPSLKTDLQNAGAHWKNAEVIVDSNLITSRKPADIPAFVEALTKVISAPSKHVAAA